MSQPNILFITSDQQHWRALGRNNPELQTPHLDRLAAEGVYCRRSYCPNPTCTPTRASLLTGQYPSLHGAWSLGTKLPENALTVGELLQTQGYDAALIGKAHFQPLLSTPEFPSLESYPSCAIWIIGANSTGHSTASTTSSWPATTPTSPTWASTMPSGWRRRG